MLSLSLGKFATVFKAEIHSILAGDYEIQMKARLEKRVGVCSDSQTALKTLQAAKITSPLVEQCRRAWNNISIPHSVGQFWVPGRSGIRENEIAVGLAREGTLHQFVGPETALGVSRQNTKEKIQYWLGNQHMSMWQVLKSTQRQVRGLISGP
jgi:uncharacterized protein with PIN domain